MFVEKRKEEDNAPYDIWLQKGLDNIIAWQSKRLSLCDTVVYLR